MNFNQTSSCSSGQTVELSTLQKAYFMGRRVDFDLHVHTHLYAQHKFDRNSIDIQRLEKALNTLLASYNMLNAWVTEDAKIHIPDLARTQCISIYNLTALDRDEAFDDCNRKCAKAYRSDFDIRNSRNIEISVILLPDADIVQINMNLMLLDGFSIRKILHELSALYEGTITSLDHKPFNVEVYERSVASIKDSPRYTRTLDNWLQQLDTFPSGPIFPIKHYVGKPRRSELIRRKHAVSQKQWLLLVERANALGVTPTALVLSAFSLILSFWSKTPSFSITMLTYSLRGKNIVELEDAVGNFASTALIKFDLQSDKTLEDIVKETHKEVFVALTKSLVCGLDVLQEKNRSEKSTFRAASPVAFVSMINDNADKVAPGIFQIEGPHSMIGGLETPQVLFDHQAISRPDGGLSLIWDTMDSAFEDSVISDMFEAYTTLIETMASDNEVWKTRHFDFRSQDQILKHSLYNATQAEITHCSLHELFYLQAEKNPQNIYIVEGKNKFSYENVRNIANSLAHELRYCAQVGPNELVAIYAGKGWQQPVAALSVLISGAAYVPIDPKQPLQRKLDILGRCHCRVVLTTSEYVNDEALTGLLVIDVNSYRDCGVTKNLASVQTPEDTAYVIFTSGSTGTPKGVTLDNLGPVNTVLDINRRIQICESDVVFGLSELNFDLSVYDIFGTAAAGATLVVPPEGAGKDPALCLSLVLGHGVTVWNSVPALAQLLVEYLQLTNASSSLPLKTCMLSGDWIPVTLPGQLNKYGVPNVLSLGGATEASIWSIYYPIERVDATWKSIPYGYPLTNQTFYVLDHNLQQRPDNVAGELYIGGIGVAKAYWGDQERTSKAYIVHPTTGLRLYRAGDWGVMRPEGHIDFLGREDGQVKVRGYRIELGEIEAVLQRHSKIQNAVVKVVGKNAQDAYIAAYWVALPESDLKEVDVIEFLSAYIPSYMIPSRFIELQALPLGATGKVDRKALPDPDQNRISLISNPPQTATEIILANLWREILNVEIVNQNDNFFDLGGNSFAAVRLMASIQAEFNLELPVTVLLESSQLKLLASSLDARKHGYEQSFSHIVTLAKNRSERSCFLFHPSGGNILCYQELARRLTAHFNVIGVQAHRGAAQGTFQTFEEMTNCYVQQVKHQQPSGPYYLGGWSMGGVIAYAVAQRLIEDGESVASLWLLDSPVVTSRTPATARDLIEWFVSDISQLDVLPRMASLETSDPKFSEVVDEAQALGLVPPTLGGELKAIFECFSANIRLLHSYVPRPLKVNVNVVVAMARQQIESRVSRRSGGLWLKYLENAKIEFIQLNTNHYGIVGSDALDKIVPKIEGFLVEDCVV